MTKNQYLLGFVATVAVLFVVRQLLPDSATTVAAADTAASADSVAANATPPLSEGAGKRLPPLQEEAKSDLPLRRRGAGGGFHRIIGVHDYRTAFPDSQAFQIVAAEQWGVKPVRNREDAERRKRELVYVGESPYFHVDRLYSSIPYLVPRAALLLQDIGQAFFDSLYVKGVPLNQLIVTSILRSMDDVAKLQRHNGNATTNSCHLYGTTFDICYNRYHPVVSPVRDDTLKWILSEVLRDKRREGRCYVKYEVKQGCFHMTVR